MKKTSLLSLATLVLVLSGFLLISLERQPKVSVSYKKQPAPTTQSVPATRTDGIVQTQVNILNDKVTTHVNVAPKK